jgi:AcrR family transcriptional regulator
MRDDDGERRDGRKERGDRTRRQVAVSVAEAASEVGLSGVSLDQVARELGISKSGVAAAFGSKQDMQLAAVQAASEIFAEHVVAPALTKRRGRPRLRALVDSWLAYVEERVFPGGCFMASVLPEFDTRPGPVRDELNSARAAWLELIAGEVAYMQENGELDDRLPPDAIAFEIDAVLAAANLERNLSGEATALTQARRVLRSRLGI